jgi:hypothetical protein
MKGREYIFPKKCLYFKLSLLLVVLGLYGVLSKSFLVETKDDPQPPSAHRRTGQDYSVSAGRTFSRIGIRLERIILIEDRAKWRNL